MNVRRMLQAGAVWGWPTSAAPLAESRSRYTVAGNPTEASGPWGRSLGLDGTNDYVMLKDSEEFLLRFDSGAQDFSIVAWVRRGATGVAQVVVDKRDADNDGWTLGFPADDFVVGSVDAFDARGPMVADTLWHCIALTVDRDGDALAYADGVAGAGTAVGGEVMTTTTLVRVGADAFSAGDKFQGDVAGIVIWDRVLTAAECLALAQPGRAF